jgi:hypothetical protein
MWHCVCSRWSVDVDRGLSEILSDCGAGALVWPMVGSHNGSGSLDLFPGSWNALHLAEIADVDRGLSEIPSGKC